MGYCPIHVDITEKTCLVVGGGEVGERKVLGLLEWGALVRVVSLALTPRLAGLAGSGEIVYEGSCYETGHLTGVLLVFAATSDPELNARIGREAGERGLLVNVADRPDLCSFIVPASVRRGNLTISISTSGTSPAVAAGIRAGLEKEYGPEYGPYLNLMGLIRQKVLALGRASRENRKVFRQLAESNLLGLVAGGKTDEIDRLLVKILGRGYTLTELGINRDDWI